jgi:methylated-DNA-protein-cysteine methyltransferase-like protein
MPRFTSTKNQMDYNVLVWEIVKRIPPGKVCTYGRIADMIPPPNEMDPKAYKAFGARWVGGAMAQCPDDVPWWRVINSQGKISARPSAGLQKELLEAEGVVFDEKEKIDLKVYLWEEGKPSQEKLF